MRAQVEAQVSLAIVRVQGGSIREVEVKKQPRTEAHVPIIAVTLVALLLLTGCATAALESSSTSKQSVQRATTTLATRTTVVPSETYVPVAVVAANTWGRVFGVTDDYVLYVTDAGSGSWSLFAYAIATGTSRLLDDTLSSGSLPYPVLSADNVAVWMGTDKGKQGVILRDLTSALGSPLKLVGPDSPDVFLAQSSGNVGLLLLEETSADSRAFVLNLYRMTDKLEVARVESPPGSSFGEDGYLQPAMDSKHIVWSAPVGTSREIFCYDIDKKTTVQITHNTVMDFKPHVAGSLVTWLSGTKDEADVYVHDLSSGVTKLIGTGVQTNVVYGGNGVQASPGGPQTDGRHVVWWQFSPPASQIMAYDSKTGSTINVSGDNRADGGPQLADGHVVWVRWTPDGETSQIVVRNLSSAAGEQVIAQGRVTDPFTNGHQIAWLDWERTSGPQDTWVAGGITLALFPPGKE